MDVLLDILKSLLFGAIIISIIEIIVPEGNLKRYFNYIAGLIFLTMIVSSFTDLRLKESDFAQSFAIDGNELIDDNALKRFASLYNKESSKILEQEASESISKEIKNFLADKYDAKEPEIKLDLDIPQNLKNLKDFNKMKISNIEINPGKEVQFEDSFYTFMKDKFNIERENIHIVPGGESR